MSSDSSRAAKGVTGQAKIVWCLVHQVLRAGIVDTEFPLDIQSVTLWFSSDSKDISTKVIRAIQISDSESQVSRARQIIFFDAPSCLAVSGPFWQLWLTSRLTRIINAAGGLTVDNVQGRGQGNFHPCL